jgi:hypothetical protein
MYRYCKYLQSTGTGTLGLNRGEIAYREETAGCSIRYRNGAAFFAHCAPKYRHLTISCSAVLEAHIKFEKWPRIFGLFLQLDTGTGKSVSIPEKGGGDVGDPNQKDL